MTNRMEEGLALFRALHFFEAHEVLEAEWRPTPRGPRRELLQGLIQLAVSLEHWRRGNPRGARGQWEKARGHLAGLPDLFEGVALRTLLEDFARFYAAHDLDGAVAAQAAGHYGNGGRVAASPVTAWPTPT